MTEVQFTAYAEDCIVNGRFDLPVGRLSDFLNVHDEFTVSQVVVEALEDGRRIELDELTLSIAEVFAVDARAGRGERGRRLRTVATGVDLELGPYSVSGFAHSRPGVDILTSLTDRKRIIPITQGNMEYTLAGQRLLRDVDTLLVNRHAISYIRHRSEALPTDLAIPRPVDARAKDFTGRITL